MRVVARLAAALALPALFLAGCESVPEGAPTAAGVPAGPLPPANLAALLPEDAAGFQRGETLPLPRGEPGREVTYATRGLPAAAATVEIRDAAGVPAGPLPPAGLAALLPEDAAGFQRGETLPLPRGEPGREVTYATRGLPAAAATVEIRDAAGGPVPDGLDSPAVNTAFTRLLQDALRPQPQRRLRESARVLLPEGTPALRCAETEGRYGRERVQGLVCAGGFRGSVVGLRLVMPQSDPPAADPRAFASIIAAALRP